MARPKVPLIDRDAATAKALDLIDRDGLDSFSTRRLAAELNVKSASLYHHFRDKAAILDAVRLRIARGTDLAAPISDDATWQDVVRGAAFDYRQMLLRHPNVAPLMHPSSFEQFGLVLRERVAAKLLDDAVPPDLVYAIIDSVELLAYSSAALNPEQRPATERLVIRAEDHSPALAKAIAAAPRAAEVVFLAQLDAVLVGWTEAIRRRLP
jgi:AcrR family transcriptional regulator